MADSSSWAALFKEPPREVRPPQYEPGWLEIMNWRGLILDRVRLPSPSELTDAWRNLMKSKLERRLPLNSTQALQCLRLLEYLFFSGKRPTFPEKLPSPPDLDLARRLLLEIEPGERSQEHIDFARRLHDACFAVAGRRHRIYIWGSLVRALSRYGCAEEAGNMLSPRFHDPDYVAQATFFDEKDGLVQAVARGLARERKHASLNRFCERASRAKQAHGAVLQSIMTCFLAQGDNEFEMKRWFNRDTGQPCIRPEAFRAMASWARHHGLHEWANLRFLTLSESRPGKKYWDVILQARLLAGESVDTIDDLISHMEDGEEKRMIQPDEDTLNGLLGVAVELRDSKLGEQIMDLGASKGIKPNGETCLIVLQLRLDTNDLDAAKGAYQQVKYSEAWRDESKLELLDRYRQLVNRYLLLLSAQPSPDFELMSSLLEVVDEDQVPLTPETVAALCLRYLENDQQMDVVDLLSGQSFLFSEAQREIVQQSLITFCLDAGTSTARAWDAYQLLNQFFQEMSLERRTKLMLSFFDRKRPDMACLVFANMRQHRSLSFHPKPKTYVACLEGFARHPDPKGLGMVHNMLKMDTTLQPKTMLNTAMMLAYTGCGKPRIALEFWDHITQSPGGPSYASLEAVFWALEKMPNGSAQAAEIWARTKQMDLDVPPRVYVAYVGAISGSGRVEEVKSLLKGMASAVRSEPGAMALAVAHNALPGRDLQEDFRKWAKSEYAETWSELDKVGRRLDEHHLCQIKVDRGMKA
ncbi:hypothetical protein XA68_15595 [Ophiocordyceps unilateralis]|uniref:Complex I intermediate-associated protein 84, mitochondrial n=1 Tax=Ophiocordyceps unilateralis TaxID=268505 RepID=A0A2A9P875_OPHUN|nr:hypothetical protein XA68_15595 [Ophiocordyceps unilateralis]